MPRKPKDRPPEEASILKAQSDEVEAICRRTGYDDEEMAARLPGLQASSFYKIRRGYQKASERVMDSIRKIELMKNFFDQSPRTPRVQEATPDKLMDEAEFILKNGTPEEVRMLRRMIEGAYSEVRQRKKKSSAA